MLEYLILDGLLKGKVLASQEHSVLHLSASFHPLISKLNRLFIRTAKNMSLFILIPLLLLTHKVSTTNIATFTDSTCQSSYRNLAGPNGYPNGTCTSFQYIGSYKSFQVVDMDEGCSGNKEPSPSHHNLPTKLTSIVTIYGASNPDDPCSPNATPQYAEIGQWYNSSWKYYSIDGCTHPQLLEEDASSTGSDATAT